MIDKQFEIQFKACTTVKQMFDLINLYYVTEEVQPSAFLKAMLLNNLGTLLQTLKVKKRP